MGRCSVLSAVRHIFLVLILFIILFIRVKRIVMTYDIWTCDTASGEQVMSDSMV